MSEPVVILVFEDNKSSHLPIKATVLSCITAAEHMWLCSLPEGDTLKINKQVVWVWACSVCMRVFALRLVIWSSCSVESYAPCGSQDCILYSSPPTGEMCLCTHVLWACVYFKACAFELCTAGFVRHCYRCLYLWNAKHQCCIQICTIYDIVRITWMHV